jgi:hypothetical protein
MPVYPGAPPFESKPLLVLTEDSDAQEEVFFREPPAGSKLRLFGSAHSGLKAEWIRWLRALRRS